MPVLADKGYQGAGIGVPAPTKNPCPTPDEETRNNLLSALRAPAERANAMFKHFRALQRVSPRAPPPSPRSWPPPSSSSPSGTIPDTNPGEKGSMSLSHQEDLGVPARGIPVGRADRWRRSPQDRSCARRGRPRRGPRRSFNLPESRLSKSVAKARIAPGRRRRIVDIPRFYSRPIPARSPFATDLDTLPPRDVPGAPPAPPRVRPPAPSHRSRPVPGSSW